MSYFKDWTPYYLVHVSKSICDQKSSGQYTENNRFAVSFWPPNCNSNEVSLTFLNIITRINMLKNIYESLVVGLKIVGNFKKKTLKYNTF